MSPVPPRACARARISQLSILRTYQVGRVPVNFRTKLLASNLQPRADPRARQAKSRDIDENRRDVVFAAALVGERDETSDRAGGAKIDDGHDITRLQVPV